MEALNTWLLLPQTENNIEYVKYVAGDHFHPGRAVTIITDKNDITSAQFMGYGVLDDVQTPVVRLQFNNGSTEDVFDVERIWSQ